MVFARRTCALHVFVDLDNTLLTSRRIPQSIVQSLPNHIHRFPNTPTEPPSPTQKAKDITLRPHSATFLNALAQMPRTRVSIFTANTDAFAESIVRLCLNPLLTKPIDLQRDVFGRSFCLPNRDAHSGGTSGEDEAVALTKKDLDHVVQQAPNFSESHSILLDDSVHSFDRIQFLAGRGMLIKPFHHRQQWTAEDELDEHLTEEVLPVIRSIHAEALVDGTDRAARTRKIVEILARFHEPQLHKLVEHFHNNI